MNRIDLHNKFGSFTAVQKAVAQWKAKKQDNLTSEVEEEEEENIYSVTLNDNVRMTFSFFFLHNLNSPEVYVDYNNSATAHFPRAAFQQMYWLNGVTGMLV